jgi:hypothetical protein
MAKNETTIKTANFEIFIDNATMAGWFEHERLGEDCAGGLWFEPWHKDGAPALALIDYDGTPELPREVHVALKAAGYLVGEEF